MKSHIEIFKYILHLFSCGAKGEKAIYMPDIDIHQIRSISLKHGIWSIVFLAVKELYRDNNNVFNMNDDIYQKLNFEFKKGVTCNIIKWNRIPDLIRLLREKEIEACLLKGMTIGCLYREPYTRATSDIDILINDTDEKKVCDILESNSFIIKHRWEGSHHVKCLRSDIGLVEIHTQLFDKDIQDLWFNMFESELDFGFIDFEYENLQCKQLDYTSALLFNFLHFFKHYISGLITVRQLMDIMLFIQKYKNDIDFKKVEKITNKLRCYKLYKILKCLSVRYLGFSLEDVGEDKTLFDFEEYVEEVLEDIIRNTESGTAGIYRIYTQKNSLAKNTKNITLKKIKRIWKLIWVGKRRMFELYGVLYKHKWLLPFMYVYRFFDRLIHIKKYVGFDSRELDKEYECASDRIELMKKLDVL